MFDSSLFDEKTFYQTFLEDLRHSQSEVIIESPFITSYRMETFDRVFQYLVKKGVKIFIITRDPKEHDGSYEVQSENAIRWFEKIEIQVLLCSGNHHRKLAILDRKILWEGSLNILSQINSREIMRRINEEKIALDMFTFLKLESVI